MLMTSRHSAKRTEHARTRAILNVSVSSWLWLRVKIMATNKSKDVEMKDVEGEEKPEVDPKQAQIEKDLLTFEGKCLF